MADNARKAQIVDYFPFPELQGSQGDVLSAVQRVLEDDGYDTVILQSPVGSGKSAMAISIARYFGTSHILTPRKQLQNQYYEDFNQFVKLMKGKSAYPCTRMANLQGRSSDLRTVVKDIREGFVKDLTLYGMPPCTEGACTHPGNSQAIRQSIIQSCTEGFAGCPYLSAIEVAQGTPHVVHNLHSFMYQISVAKRFEKRRVLIVDECHDMADIVRGFLSKTICLNTLCSTDTFPTIQEYPDLVSWADWFEGCPYKPRGQRIDEVTGLTSFEESIEELRKAASYMRPGNFSISIVQNISSNLTKITFTPIHIGKSPSELFLDYGVKVVMMSGTIYNKTMFCRELGLDPNRTAFIDVNSTFPENLRPVLMDSRWMVDTSHKCWERNFQKLIENCAVLIKGHMGKGENGLLHAPSYAAARQISRALRRYPEFRDKVIHHDPDDFLNRLNHFYSRPNEGLLFISPVCQQGVDFKYDRARYQIICRVPYLNASDGTVANMLASGRFDWYNWRALIVFGQQCGRINRAPDDRGVTYLMDSRFKNFIKKNRGYLPAWFMNSIKQR